MLASLNLGNFKAFGETQCMPIRPITLFYGPNSSGKSSIFHGLAVAHETLRTGNIDILDTEIGGSSIDLGGFQQYIFGRRIERKFTWGAEFRTSLENEYSKSVRIPAEIINVSATFGIQNDGIGEIYLLPRVQSYEIGLDGKTILQISRELDGKLTVVGFFPESKYVLSRVPTFTTILEKPELEEFLTKQTKEEVTTKVLSEIEIRENKFIPTGIHQNRQDDLYYLKYKIELGNKTNIDLVYESFIRKTINDLLKSVGYIIDEQISRFCHLGPLRKLPPRNLLLFENTKSAMDYDDLNCWNSLIQNEELRAKVNCWLGGEKLKTNYKLVVNELPSTDQILADPGNESIELSEKRDLRNSSSLFKTEVSISKTNIISEMLLNDLRTGTIVSHRDVGIGISQVLPVLVAAYGHQNKLIAIEQPENHIHPSLQCDLADVFINSALNDQKNTFLLETHSEHIILRILKRIRQTASGNLPEGISSITPDDVSVLYFEPEDSGTRVFSIGIGEDGRFKTRWPNGFFDERMAEFE